MKFSSTACFTRAIQTDNIHRIPRIVSLILLFLAVLVSRPLLAANDASILLLRNPAIHGDQIVFQYRDDLWTACSDGTQARALTSGPGRKSSPPFSPDGWIAFTGNYDDNKGIALSKTCWARTPLSDYQVTTGYGK